MIYQLMYPINTVVWYTEHSTINLVHFFNYPRYKISTYNSRKLSTHVYQTVGRYRTSNLYAYCIEILLESHI